MFKALLGFQMKGRKAICQITKEGTNVGFGCLVYDPQMKNPKLSKYCIISSFSEVIQPVELRECHVLFKRVSNSDSPRDIQLRDIFKDSYSLSSGLVLIFIDGTTPSQLHHHGCILRRKCSVLKHLPEISAHTKMKKKFYFDERGRTEYDEESGIDSSKNAGFVLFEEDHRKLQVVGIVNCFNSGQEENSPIWLTSSSLEDIIAITQADSEVHTDASIRASLQPPPNNSNGTPNRSNEPSDLSRNGQDVDTEEEEQDKKKEEEDKNRKEEQDRKKEEEDRKRKEEQDRRKKEEEDRKRKEEQDRRKKEEEDRKEVQKEWKKEQDIDGPPAAGLKSSDETKLNITLASDDEGWNKTVNGQLVIELGRNTRLKVTGFVPKNTSQQREHARSLNIELVDAKDHAAFSSSELLSFPPDSLEIDILLIHAHGQDLGRQAQIIKEVKKCTWVQVVHTLEEELFEGQQRLQTLCEKADFIIAVGPKVADACKRALRSSQKHVFDLTPGVFEELSGVHQLYGDLREFHVLLSGSSEYFSLKGCDIAAKAIKLLNTPSASYHLTVMVKPGEEEVKKALLCEGIDSFQLTVRVSDSHDDWCKMLCKADLAIKPSRNEGFGMSGLLAISANLPVLVSESSGLGIVLKNIPLGNSSVVASDDPKVWANRIKEVRAKTSEIRHAEAVQLREAYMQQFSWKDECGKLVEELFRIVPQKSGGHDVTTMSSAQTLNSKETTENIQIRMQNASLSERNATSETKQKMAGDVVDAGVNQNGSQVNDRLSTSVKGIPLSVYGPLCLMLNVKRDVKYDDFRMLAEKVGLNRDETNYIEQLKNPTNEILKTWSKKNEATVGKLIDILKGEHLERMDAVKLLEDWVNQT